MRSHNKKLNTSIIESSNVFLLLSFLLVVSAIFYGYFLQNSVFNIVNRENLDKSISSLGIKVSSLESEYLSLRNGVSIDEAVRLGLKENFDKMNFANVDNNTSKGGLSFLGNEI